MRKTKLLQKEQCPICKITYGEMKTSFCFEDIYMMLWKASNDSSLWKYKRRNTILGKWHQIKLEMWERHLEDCNNPNNKVKFLEGLREY